MDIKTTFMGFSVEYYRIIDQKYGQNLTVKFGSLDKVKVTWQRMGHFMTILCCPILFAWLNNKLMQDKWLL